MLVMNAKKEASSVAEEITDKVDKVANPVLELAGLRRVRFSSKKSLGIEPQDYHTSCMQPYRTSVVPPQ